MNPEIQTNRMRLAWLLLPTKNTSNLFIYDEDGKLYHDASPLPGKTKGDQYVYFASDAPVKEGNYYISSTDSGNSICLAGKGYVQQSWEHKIEFTTDPKLIADGVPAIDGNTKAVGTCPNCNGKGCELCDGMPYEVNFLTEFCKRYNQKDKGVDVEKLAGKIVKEAEKVFDKKEAISFTQGFIKGYNQALQSIGQYSLEDVISIVLKWDNHINLHEEDKGNIPSIQKFIQSLQPQSKGDIVIEVEMEEILGKPYMAKGRGIEMSPSGWIIKLTNEQPTLIFN